MKTRIYFLSVLLAALVTTGGSYGGGSYSGGGGGGSYLPRLAVPDAVFCAAGRELNFFYDQLGVAMPGVTGGTYAVESTLGRPKDWRYRWRPGAAASVAATITAVDASGNVAQRVTTMLTAVAATAGAGSSKKVLLVGDSVMAGDANSNSAADIPETIAALATADGGGVINLMGQLGTTPNFHEGNSGYKWSDYGTAGDGSHPNPFWIGGKLDFQAYVAHLVASHSQSGPIDYCVVMAGYNDLCTSEVRGGNITSAQMAALIQNVKDFCAALLSASTGYPACKILLVLPGQACAALSGYTASYSGWSAMPASGWWYFDRNERAFELAMIQAFDHDRYSTSVDVVAAGLNVDRRNGYAVASAESVSARVGTTDVLGVSNVGWANFLHPNLAGGQQYADAIYSALRYQRSIEVPGTNLLANSVNFGDASWTKTSTMSTGSTDTDPLGGSAAQVWTTQTNTAGYVTYTHATSGLLLAAHNVLSCYYKYGNANAAPKLRIQVTGGSPGTYAIDMLQTAAGTPPALAWYEPAYTPTLWTNGSGNLPGSYRIDAVGNNWFRCQFYCQGGADVGRDIEVQIFMERQTNQAAHTIEVWGAQFEQGVTTASGYQARP